jgi:hypothetical protein
MKLANIWVLEAPVNLDLRHEFLSCATLCQRCFLNDFASMDFHIFTNKLETASKSSLAQKLSFLPSTNAVRSVFLFDFFLNYRLLGG